MSAAIVECTKCGNSGASSSIRDWCTCGFEERTEPMREWWCPTEARWMDCPGPCPDGTEHDGPETFDRSINHSLGKFRVRGPASTARSD